MADENYTNANAIAQIQLIWTNTRGSIPKVLEQQAAYDTRMAGGGTPDAVGSKNLFSSNRFEIKITRFDAGEFPQSGIYQKYLRAWTKMPLFAGDIIESGPNLNATVEFLSGGRFFVMNKGVWRINAAGDATNYQYKAGSVMHKFFFAKDRPLTIQKSGGMLGIRG